ncbi:LysR substrate-binding domain-containing protein [Novosphingobium terrae]|uniref:LysR substrate-binding domain-containing protein n=1 Tax=Novosphingobium terrae TaxID=2726189 RepID=UPI00197F61A0|nr:LysR substrate-binding domain-containing protein [Novosphingobium terrae]
MPSHFDLDCLRSFVAAQDLGGFNRAAEVLNRSQSAVSQQLRKLEEQAGQPLTRRDGRQLVLTPAGDTVLAYARRLLALNDEAMAALGNYALAGQVRFGVVGDLAESWLPAMLASFQRAHPQIVLEVCVDRASALFEALDRGALDLVLTFGGDGRIDAMPWRALPQRWLGAVGGTFTPDERVELAVLPSPCRFRKAAIDQLEAAGIPWRIAFTGHSVAALWAAVRAGLGVTFRAVDDMPQGIAAWDEPLSVPQALPISVNLHDGGRPADAAIDHLRGILLELKD